MVTVFWPLQVPVAVILASCPVGIFDTGGAGPICETLTGSEALGGVLIVLGLLSCTAADMMERKETSALQAPLLSTQFASQPTGYPEGLYSQYNSGNSKDSPWGK